MQLITAQAVTAMKSGTIFLVVDHTGALRAYRSIHPSPPYPYALEGVAITDDPEACQLHARFAPECEVIV